MSTNKAIVRCTITISLATGLSRVLGFVRDILVANFFGTGLAAEAFVVAQRIPNLLRDLVGEGAANSAFVPVFSEYRFKKDPAEFWQLVYKTLAIIFLFLVAVCLAGIIFAPQIVRFIAPGFFAQPEKFLLTVKLTRITFPYLALIGLSAYQMGILHTFKSFTAPALGPAMLNVGMIITLLFAVRFMNQPVRGLAIGVLVGGMLQLVVQVPSLYRLGFRFNFKSLKPDFRHSGIKKIGKLLSPRILGSAVYQLNVFADTILASLSTIVGAGGVAAIYYANRIIQLPMALFGIALSSAVLPTMSEQVVQEDAGALKKTLSFSLRAIYLLILPASLGAMVLASPIIKVLFQHGRFDSYSTSITAAVLVFYSVGLVAFAGTKILVSCFYSLQDTVTPVRSALTALIINVILNLILMFPMKVSGLALASSISAFYNFFNLYFILRKRIGVFEDRLMFDSLRKISIAALLLSALAMAGWYYSCRFFSQYFALAATIIIASTGYLFACKAMGVKEIDDLIRWILRKK